MKILVSIALVPLLLGACCSPPDLRVNWYAVPAMPRLVPSTPSPASSPAPAPELSPYQPLVTSNRLLLAVLNRDERRVTIHCIEVNPPHDSVEVPALSCEKGGAGKRPWRGNVLSGMAELASGESLIVDLTSTQPEDLRKQTRGPCHIPVRLRVHWEQADRSGQGMPDARIMMLTISDPLPSAIPDDWEMYCMK